MSSACVCHLNEWCFYCEKFLPLENERDQLRNQVVDLKSELWSIGLKLSVELQYKFFRKMK